MKIRFKVERQKHCSFNQANEEPVKQFLVSHPDILKSLQKQPQKYSNGSRIQSFKFGDKPVSKGSLGLSPHTPHQKKKKKKEEHKKKHSLAKIYCRRLKPPSGM
jgi:hypothetical protein